MKELSIGDVARQAGVSQSTIRYYEQIGLMPVAERQSGRRIYRLEAIKRVKMIRAAQKVGWSLTEIKEILGQSDGKVSPSAAARWRSKAPQQINKLSAQIDALQAMKATLEESLSCDCEAIETCDLVLAIV